MSYKLLSEILKYFDFFGTNYNFYIERNRKYYTAFGGVLTLLSIIVGILVFIFVNLEDFLHTSPISTTSTSRENYRNIKFSEEKIWIPWRIRDYNGKTVDYNGLFYPIAYYYKGIFNNTKKALDLSYEIRNSKLCNETSMANNSNSYIININLDNLYCIDMEELDMGGSWDIDFINYIEFDLFSCKDGINYDENNTNCSSYEKISNSSGYNNSYEFEIYYPVVHYQPMNKTTPIFVRYANYFYHLSRFSNKIDRIYLQQHILKDDNGWFIKKEKTSSHWGYISLNGDSYATGNKKDLMNEGSSSRFYSFNIYLKSDVVYYNRSYKKLFLVIADGLPIVSVIFIIFKLIAKVFKISSGNKKLTELLFENLQEKQNKRNGDRFNAIKINKKKINSEKIISTPKNKNSSQNNYKLNLNNTTSNININDVSSLPINSQKEQGKKKLFPSEDKRRNSIEIGSRNDKSKFFQNLNLNSSQINLQNKIVLNQSSNNNFSFNQGNIGFNNNNININIHNNNIGNLLNSQNNEVLSTFHFKNSKVKKKISGEENKNNIFSKNISNKKNKTFYIQKTLFPYKYYLCSIFIKNIDVSKKSLFFTKKFIVVYNFICQLFDISSYLILQREFQILKSIMMIGKNRAFLENRQKINVNDHSFNTDMKECLDSQKFSILGRVKDNKNFNNQFY